MMARLFLVALFLLYLLIIFPFTSYMKERPLAIKLGFFPEATVLKIAFADFKNLVAQNAVVNVLFYYGTLVGKMEGNVQLKPEYFNMFKTLQTAVKLDPYNLDAYYFAQAVFTWDLHRIKEVNDLLDHGMKYRSWDYQLPFYAGFNAAFFQKDYASAARYMQQAAQLSGQPLFTNLAARYFYEAGQTELGLLFLEAMEKGAKDNSVRKLYTLRKEALTRVDEIEEALERYRVKYNKEPSDLNDLVAVGLLRGVPPDPYGGKFYIDEDGRVKSTSRFALTTSGDVPRAGK